MMLVIDFAKNGRRTRDRVKTTLRFKVSLSLQRMTNLLVLSLLKMSRTRIGDLVIIKVVRRDSGVASHLVEAGIEE